MSQNARNNPDAYDSATSAEFWAKQDWLASIKEELSSRSREDYLEARAESLRAQQQDADDQA